MSLLLVYVWMTTSRLLSGIVQCRGGTEDGGRLSFPPLAAGGLCTSRALATFLIHLARAYEANTDARDLPISPNTALVLTNSLVN